MMDQAVSFFVSNAFADAPASPPQSGGFSFITMFIIFMMLLYFALWRPQSKRAKEQRNLLSSLAKGDEVITAGGLLGRIHKVNDQYVSLSIAENVNTIVQKESITGILPKGTIKSME